MALPDLVVLSHLRWGFVYQRPQHLMVRFARDRRVFFVEEPIFDDGPTRMQVVESAPNVFVATPHITHGSDVVAEQRRLLDQLRAERAIDLPVVWFYTPMAMRFAGHIPARAVVYDCMDELSAFLGAPRELLDLEKILLAASDLVFTGGHSLYEAKRDKHASVHAFPSSVDAAHFEKALTITDDAEDQAHLRRPRLGFYGVVDERMDLPLVEGLADARPDWEIVIVGPVVKIDPASRPARANLHWIGQRSYDDLPRYLAGWDVAIMPFALNEATRFISPTKTLEFLAAGKPVVSTPIRDVVRPYGDAGVVHIARSVDEFVHAADRALREPAAPRRARASAFLAQTSWDRTHAKMAALIENACSARTARSAATQLTEASL